MTRVQILPVTSADCGAKDQAVFGNRQVDADYFFGSHQIERHSKLMTYWRAYRDSTTVELPEADQRELEALIEKELQSVSDRSVMMAKELCG